MNISGLWHIKEMEMWDEEYLNEEVQAYIRIDKSGQGDFQFGYVSGSIDGDYEETDDADVRFYFSWDGADEMDPASGMGWLELKGKNKLVGKLKFHNGDSSELCAIRAKQKR